MLDRTLGGATMKVKYKVWLESDNHAKAFGKGPYELLRHIKVCGSLNKACQIMGISYTKASSILMQCEEATNMELLHRSAGGSFGGGSDLTQAGEKLMKDYETFINEVDLTIKQLYTEHFEFG